MWEMLGEVYTEGEKMSYSYTVDDEQIALRERILKRIKYDEKYGKRKTPTPKSQTKLDEA